ncbi:MAG: DUF4209 domain-containing protein [Oscillatoria sp. PMC 1051.18]|nr:DUF4209 domain-containing protein [Oscillatoria sp. PMC 1050.18]MEC5031195.1 DUF4209 domain-containing protein [Oscillatoria sp. PMC 1051.18]
MESLNPPLAKNDFINSRWYKVVNSSERKECSLYYRGFLKKAQEAQEAGNIREQAVFDILATVTFAEIEPESNENFFAKVFHNFAEEDLNFLAEIVTDISDPELQARVADLLWAKRKDYQMAQLAVTSYLESAKELENPDHWDYCFVRIERALYLALKINHKIEAVVKYMKTVLERYAGEDRLWFLSENIMELLQKKELKLVKFLTKDELRKYADLAEKTAILAEDSYNWDIARTYWKIKEKWHLIQKDGEKERAASMQAAETYVKKAQDALSSSTSAPYLTASFHLNEAVKAFRNIRGTTEEKKDYKARAKEVHKLLLQYQEKCTNELITMSITSSDVSGYMEQAREQVRDKPFKDALLTLVSLCNSPKVSYLQQQVEKNAVSSLSPYFSGKKINDKGKVIATQSSDPDDREKVNIFEMYNLAIKYQKAYAKALIEPAREQIYSEHSIQEKDLLPIVTDSYFVPEERKYLFAKGLYAGLIGDFVTFTHILIPQIENSVRYLLWKLGVITSGLDDSGIQNEHNLNTTLYCPEITSIFDEDTLFDLKGLLIEHSGSNLRNRMAHGLISHSEFSSSLMSYLWWLTLRLCCLPSLNYQQKLETSDPWVRFAGIFKDDPLFDEFVEDMAVYRRELDAELTEDDVTYEESQST